MKTLLPTFVLFVVQLVSAPMLEAHAVGRVVFIHPDGTGLGHWNAARHYYAGPDGMLNWDRMEHLASYRVHQKNWLSTSSHAGATVHAYGKKVHYNSYGLDRNTAITALSGKNMTIMEEAMSAGVRVGIVNSGHIGEPGTGVFLARSESRGAVADIAAQILSSGADVIFCGGEKYMIPVGTRGKHGKEGVRLDERDLLSEVRAHGYTVIFTREELMSLPVSTRKIIGVFAAENTYNDKSEHDLKSAGLETYDPEAPSFDEMVDVALRILGSNPEDQFFLVAEEEGTDNFSNVRNSQGMLDAIGRADKAIGVTLDFINRNPQRSTLLIVGADSDAGHPGIWAPRNWETDYSLPDHTGSGAELDGPEGAGGNPFWTQPDQFGISHPFGIAWGHEGDMPGSAVTKTHGAHSELMGSSLDNTGIYKMIFQALFGRPPVELN